jgi:hypothetical protein
MTMWLKWFIIILALLQAGWMTFDGTRALVVGDYVTPKSGEYAGRLGPWSSLVQAIGILPRSTLMRSIFVIYGVTWLIVIACYVLKLPWAWAAMLIAAIGGLWYLPIGTAFSLLQIVLLLLPKTRALH